MANFDNDRTMFPLAVENRDVLRGIHVNRHVPRLIGATPKAVSAGRAR
jgi:hypothetical protein